MKRFIKCMLLSRMLGGELALGPEPWYFYLLEVVPICPHLPPVLIKGVYETFPSKHPVQEDFIF